MKKTICVILAVFLLFVCALPASAAGIGTDNTADVSNEDLITDSADGSTAESTETPSEEQTDTSADTSDTGTAVPSAQDSSSTDTDAAASGGTEAASSDSTEATPSGSTETAPSDGTQTTPSGGTQTPTSGGTAPSSQQGADTEAASQTAVSPSGSLPLGADYTQGDSTILPGSDSAVTLRLETSHVYEGMNSSYAQGYIPTTTGGTAIIVLPLTADGGLANDRLTAAVDLGTTVMSPFVYKNYQKDFTLSAQPVNGSSATAAIYYIRFDLELSPKRYIGVYPVNIRIDAADTRGGTVSQSFTVYVTITDGIDPNAVETVPAPSEETPTSSPIVLLTSCVIEPDPVLAGGEFTARITLKNTSSKKSVQNMVVTITPPGTDFKLLDDAAAVFLGKLGKEESTEITFRYAVSIETPEGQYPFSLSMQYDDPKAVTCSSSGSFSVNVEQPLDVSLTVPQVPAAVTAGDTIPLDFQVLNLGRAGICNVRCDVSGNGLKEVTTAFIGDMQAGTEGSASLNLFISTLDAAGGTAASDRYGLTTGVITLTYEDSRGTEYTQEYTFDTEIKQPVIVTAAAAETEEPQTAGQWWITAAVLGGIAVLAAVGLGAYWLGKRK